MSLTLYSSLFSVLNTCFLSFILSSFSPLPHHYSPLPLSPSLSESIPVLLMSSGQLFTARWATFAFCSHSSASPLLCCWICSSRGWLSHMWTARKKPRTHVCTHTDERTVLQKWNTENASRHNTQQHRDLHFCIYHRTLNCLYLLCRFGGPTITIKFPLPYMS